MNKFKLPEGVVNQAQKIRNLNIPGKEKMQNLGTKVKDSNTAKFFSSSKFVKLLIWLLFFISIIQIGFGIMVYGLKSTDQYTRIVAKVIPYPVAVVNQDIITYAKYLHERDYIHHFYESTGQQGIDYAAIDKEITNQLVENKLLATQAKFHKTSVTKNEVDEAINQIIEQNGGEDKVVKTLDDMYGLNLDQFKNLVREQLTRDKLNDKIIMRVTASHILVRVDKEAPQDQVDAAKAKIDGYLNEINVGLDFAEAAKKYSEDTGSAETGGSLDAFANGEMVPEFSEAAFKGEVGKIVGPVRTDFGWHIIKIEGKTGTIEKPFVDWLADIKNKSFILSFVK